MGVLGNLMEHKAQCSLWHFKAPSVSPPFKPLGMTHLWQCYITHYGLKAPAILLWKAAHSWLILQSLRSTLVINTKFPWPPCSAVCTLVSGQCHSFPVHKEDVSCSRVTTDNSLFSCVFYEGPCDTFYSRSFTELHKAFRAVMQWMARTVHIPSKITLAELIIVNVHTYKYIN